MSELIGAHPDVVKRTIDELKRVNAADIAIRDKRIAELEERFEEDCQRIAELESLVRHMNRCMAETYAEGSLVCLSCEECPYDNDKCECDFTERMAELGIEEKK